MKHYLYKRIITLSVPDVSAARSKILNQGDEVGDGWRVVDTIVSPVTFEPSYRLARTERASEDELLEQIKQDHTLLSRINEPSERMIGLHKLLWKI